MKRILQAIIVLALLTLTSVTYAQKLEKIKGSKLVTLSEIELDSVSSIELYKGINLILKKSDKNQLNIYADDNLHDVVDIDLNEGKLSLSILRRITSKKEFELTLYVKNLNEIILDDNSTLTGNEFFNVTNLNIILNNKSKMECLFDASETIIFQGNDTSKSVSNLRAQTINYTLQDRSRVDGMSNSGITKINSEGKSNISVSGKSEEVFIISTQSADVKLTNLICNIIEIVAEDKSSVYIKAKEDITISMKDDSKIYIYGKADIDLIDFNDKATLYKKE